MKLIIFLLFPFYSSSQNFEKSKDEFLKENYIRYYDRGAGIIVQKTFTSINDSSSAFYEVALVTHKDAKSVDDIMRKRGVIVFDDKTFLLLNDQVYFDFLMEGKRQYTLKHKLTNDELSLLQSKKIDYINLVGLSNSLDKWQKQNYIKIFNEISSQKF